MFINTNIANIDTAEVLIAAGSHRGKQQWYAQSVPEQWRSDPGGEVHRVVINFPSYVVPLEGELWELQRQHSVPGIIFALAKKKVSNPAGVPEVIEGGVKLTVSDCPENIGNRFRHHGRVATVEDLHLYGQSYLRIYFQELVHEPIELIPGSKLEVHVSNMIQLHDLHMVGQTLHAYHGDRLVMIYRS